MQTIASAPQHVNFARRIECEEDGLYFNRYFFKERFGSKMIVNGHHHAMQAALDRTMLAPSHPDFIPRLVINVPPGYTKTEQAVIGHMARGIAINPQSRFLHLSYSQKLALINSTTCRSLVKSKAFQQMWQVRTKDDVDSKEVWHTTKNGGVTASTILGQVTGFRAGHMDAEEYSGALIIDDPVNPKTAGYDTQRQQVNEQYSETIASRLAVETVPIIVVMQRVHWDDLSGHLLTGGSGEMWHHLDLSVIIENNKPYPEEFTHGIPIAHGLPDGWLWPMKHNDEHHAALKAHRRRYWAQYRQRPIKRDEETALWTEETINTAQALDFGTRKRTVVAVDPAASDDKTSDEHGIVVASEYEVPNRYSVDADYTRKGSPNDWAQAAIAAYHKYEAACIVVEKNQGGDMCANTLVNAGFKGIIELVHASKGKTTRAEPIAALYELGHIAHTPLDPKVGGLGDLEDEMLDFDPLTGKSNGASPNRVDAAVWALTHVSGEDVDMEELLKLALGNS